MQGAVPILHALHKLAPMPRRYSHRSSTRSPQRSSSVLEEQKFIPGLRSYFGDDAPGKSDNKSAINKSDKIKQIASKLSANHITSWEQETSPSKQKLQSKKEMKLKALKSQKRKPKLHGPEMQQKRSSQSVDFLLSSHQENLKKRNFESFYQLGGSSSIVYPKSVPVFQEMSSKPISTSSALLQGGHKVTSLQEMVG